MNTTHQRLQALEGRIGRLQIRADSQNPMSPLRSSRTITGAGLNFSYRVLHPSGICFGNDSVFSSQTPPVKFWSLKKWKAADPALLIGDFVRL